MFINRTVLFVGLFLTLLSITSALQSPCPDLFHYDSTDQAGQWTGTITVGSDTQLYGVWIRLIFDQQLTQLIVDDNSLEVVANDNTNEILIKNKNIMLNPGRPINIKITAKYDGNKVPSLVGYRLNANMVCGAENIASEDFFPGDLASSGYLFSHAPSNNVLDFTDIDGCGTVPSLQQNSFKNQKAQKGQWPWQAAIYIQKNNEEQYACEATLVSFKHLITSAHCVTYQGSGFAVPTRRLTVYTGKYNRGQQNNVQTLEVEKIHVHPGYRAANLLDDIAIIELSKPVVADDYTRPICVKNSSNKKEGFVVGYGINRNHELEDLTQAEVKVISDKECSKVSNLRNFLIDNVFCASYIEDNTLCVGDSGSSLVSLREGAKAVWELKGVVTVGVALQNKDVCNRSNTVLLFTDITNNLKWIQNIIS